MREELTFMEPGQVLTNKWYEAESRPAEVCYCERRVRLSDKVSKALCVAGASVDMRTAKSAILTARTMQEKAEHGPSPGQVWKLEDAALTRNEEIGVPVWDVQSLKGRVAPVENRGYTAEARDRWMLEEISSLQTLVDGFSPTVSSDPVLVAWLVEADLECVSSISFAALLESEGTGSEATCAVSDRFPGIEFSGAPDRASRGPSDLGLVLFIE